MHNTFVARFLLAVLLIYTFSAAQVKPESEYATLLARVKSGDAVDFKRLRFSFVDSPEYQKAKDVDAEKKAMTEALNSNRFEEAIRNADAVLANKFVDMDAHFTEYIAHRELKHDELSKFHKNILSKLLKSITDSGDGKSKESAMAVISTHEEYVVLQFMDLTPMDQSLVKADGHTFDVIEAKNSAGETVSVYFNIDVPIRHFE